jgi:hypothetical protein
MKWENARARVSEATAIMISSLLMDSSDGLDAVLAYMIVRITSKVQDLFTVYILKISSMITKEILRSDLYKKLMFFLLTYCC